MFARPFYCRAAQQSVKRSVPRRGYASESGSSPSTGTRLAGYTAVGALVAGSGYYAYNYYQGKTNKVSSPISTPKEATKAFTGGDQGFLSLKLNKVEDITHNTKKFWFALPEKDQVSGLPVASALLTKFQDEGMKEPVLRPYTPVSEVDVKGELEMIIKRYPNGPMSEHIFSLKPGQTLDFKGPLPKYPITTNKHNHISMIAGGTGITPMWQVLQSIFKDPNDKTKVTLIYGNISEEDIILRKELNKLENTYPQRFRAFYLLDKPPEGWTQGKGYITKDLVQSLIPEAKEDNVKVLVCGPPGLYKAVSGTKKSPKDQGELSGILKELGYTKDQVFKF